MPPTLTLADLEISDPNAPPAKPGWGSRERRFLCPLCVGHTDPKRHRSLAVNTDTGAWNCHRCHASGKLREWWTAPEAGQEGKPRGGVARERARRQARHRFGLETVTTVTPAASNPGEWLPRLGNRRPLKGTPGAAYLEARGLPLDLCHRAGVRFSPNYCHDPEKPEEKPGFAAVVFAITDEEGKAVAGQGRAINGPAKITFGPRALGVFITPSALEAPFLTVVEAPIDALTLALCGVPAVATCGTKGVPDWLMDRFAFGVAVAAQDSDEAGDKAAANLARHGRVVGIKTTRLRPPAGRKDWNEALVKDGEAYVREHLRRQIARVERLLSPPAVASLPAPKMPLPGDLPSEETEAPTEAPDAPEQASGEDAEPEEAEEADPEYAALIQTAYLAALAGTMPKEALRLGPGRTLADPNRWMVLAIERARFLRAQFGARWRDAGGPGRDGDQLAADIETVARWYAAALLVD